MLTAEDLAVIEGMITAGAGAGEGFDQPIVAGQLLLIPGIQSPNFSLAGSTGWQILKSGLATFFNVVLSGGTVTGPDYILNSQGFFLYSGPPASGNLILAIVSAAGTDGFLNPVPQGLMAQQLTLVNQGSAPPAFAAASVFYSSLNGRPRYLSSAGADMAVDRSAVNVAQFTIGNTASRLLISAPLNYLAGEGTQSSEYEIEMDGIISTGTTTTPTLTFDLGVDGTALGASFVIGGAYLTVNGSFAYSITFRLAILTSGAGGTALLASAGTVINRSGTALGNAGTWLSVGASSADLTKAFDSTVGHTLQVFGKWASTNTGQSVITYRTRVTRRF